MADKKQAAQSVTDGTGGVSVSGGYRGRGLRRRLSWFLGSRKRKQIAMLALGVILIGVVLAIAIYFGQKNETGDQSISSQQYNTKLADEQAAILSSADLTAEERIKHLQVATRSELDAGRHEKARAYYEQLMKLLGSKQLSNSMTYLDGTAIYLKLGDKKLALEQLEKAEATDKKISNEELRNDAKTNTDYYREQLQ